MKDMVQSTVLAVLGRARRQHQDWFDENDAAIRNLLAEKNRLFRAYVYCSTDDNKAAFYHSRRLVQLRLREMQEACADRTTLLIEKLQHFQRWAEHFRGVLSRLSTTSDAAIARLSQVETNTGLDLSKKPPGLCSGYAAGKRLDQTQLLLRSTDMAAPYS
nr:unnamed protein product [Spirometra erinaceieuropaei]